MIKKDGHTHTQFSHHGSEEKLDQYIEYAIELGFKEYVVTEHAPLPSQFFQEFVGPKDAQINSAMTNAELPIYREEVKRVQKKYKNNIMIKAGLEVDYLQKYESQTREFLQENKDWIDEIVLSVHFLPNSSSDIVPIDYDPETLSNYFMRECREPKKLFERYYEAVSQSVQFDTGLLDTTIRIGHLTLIRKYQKLLNLPKFDIGISDKILNILQDIKRKNYQLDFNAAGFSKPYNGESYPTFEIAESAKKIGIPLIYGSDAHNVAALGLHFDEMNNFIENI
ncbi:histidinol-phosphatase [Leuconostoc litchii]|uniref:Histidinol-phosphatase n=1 Tax=Leuconostoc litchii TaxID=1981069 RepID=A0A6P2CPX5_9LACO|nr:histidinol-phosphatase HisJ [Leuconostoc litchii]TYC46192.1 histidinol-phosphatase HisJ [Leuconostoc litchii]GMA70350.1 histidinol-phosphatase [Leuconostoc litchii]